MPGFQHRDIVPRHILGRFVCNFQRQIESGQTLILKSNTILNDSEAYQTTIEIFS